MLRIKPTSASSFQSLLKDSLPRLVISSLSRSPKLQTPSWRCSAQAKVWPVQIHNRTKNLLGKVFRFKFPVHSPIPIKEGLSVLSQPPILANSACKKRARRTTKMSSPALPSTNSPKSSNLRSISPFPKSAPSLWKSLPALRMTRCSLGLPSEFKPWWMCL